jgi:16S rRNA U516 pseudouridylate synthase RsuA-like enzyme
MTAGIWHPTLRLIRVRIKNLLLGEMKPGEVRLLSSAEVKELKGL